MERERERKVGTSVSGDGSAGVDVECGTWGIARVVDGVQVREQYISVTRRRVIKGWCCRWVQVNLWPPDEILFPQQRLV